MNELFLKIINMSISASWLVLAVLILRLILKKAPKWVNVLLWGIVAIRLICPFSFESALSLIPSAETIPMNIGMDTTPTINSGINAINNAVNPIISQSNTPTAGASANPLQITIGIYEYIWIFGMIALALYTTISYWHLRRKVDTAVRYRDNIFQSENANSPFVLGIIKPKIYLPFKTDGQDMEHVIAHEQAHIRRKDHWWKPLGFLLLTIHWFNPLMWLAYVLLCRDIELACDEKVIKELGNEQRANYTQALVACSVNRRMIAACPLAFGEVGVKERVKSVMNYKKPAFWIIILAVTACVVVAVCFLTNPKQDSYTLRIVVPAGSQEEFVYSDEEVSTIKNSIKIWSGDGLGDTEVLLSPVNETTEAGYTATYLTHGMPVVFDAEKDTWFKIGVNMQNPTDEDIIVYVEVENVEVRISNEIAPDSITFEAEILEIHDGYFLVKPESSWAMNSADQIEVPMMNMDPALEPQVGDIIEIVCSGEILETYPARLQEVYSISVAVEAEELDLLPMVMVDGKLYLDTGLSSNADARCGVMDGEITSTVDGSQRPTENNQSNFGTGYGYQIGATEGTIEIYMNEEWWIFATEEVRNTLHFPTTERAFEFNFAGNTSGGQEMELTEIYPYWCIEIENTGNGTIQMEIQGEVYRVEAGATKTFCSDEKWKAGTYTVSFSTTGYQPMQGSAICTRSKAPITDKQDTSASTYNPKGVSGNNVKELSRISGEFETQDGVSFVDLAPSEEVVSSSVITLEENSSVMLFITWGAQDLFLEFGIRAADGAKFFQEKQGGSSVLLIEDIPAGTYSLYVKNSDAYNGIPAYENPDSFEGVSFNATGAMNYITNPD